MLAISLQKDMLLPWRTILDNIILGMEVRGVPYNEAVGRARLMEKYGLKGFDKHYPKELSGGMKQRAARRGRALRQGHHFAGRALRRIGCQTRLTMQNWCADLGGFWQDGAVCHPRH